MWGARSGQRSIERPWLYTREALLCRCRCVLLRPHLDTSMPFLSQFRSVDTATQHDHSICTTTPSHVANYIVSPAHTSPCYESSFLLTCQRRTAPRPSTAIVGTGLTSRISRTTYLRNPFSGVRLFRSIFVFGRTT